MPRRWVTIGTVAIGVCPLSFYSMSLIQERYADNLQQMPAPQEQSLKRANEESRVRRSLSNRALGWLRPGSTPLPVVLRRLNWLIPVSLFLLVVGYQLGPAQWIHHHLGHPYHTASEVLVFGTAGPFLAFGFIYLLRLWLEERDTSDLQSQLLEQAQEEVKRSRQLNDDTLQVLFAAGAMLDTLKTAHPTLDDDLSQRVERTEETLQKAVQQLRSHLLEAENSANGRPEGGSAERPGRI